MAHGASRKSFKESAFNARAIKNAVDEKSERQMRDLQGKV
jgi:hypothetical protein